MIRPLGESAAWVRAVAAARRTCSGRSRNCAGRRRHVEPSADGPSDRRHSCERSSAVVGSTSAIAGRSRHHVRIPRASRRRRSSAAASRRASRSAPRRPSVATGEAIRPGAAQPRLAHGEPRQRRSASGSCAEPIEVESTRAPKPVSPDAARRDGLARSGRRLAQVDAAGCRGERRAHASPASPHSTSTASRQHARRAPIGGVVAEQVADDAVGHPQRAAGQRPVVVLDDRASPPRRAGPR